MFTTQVFIGRPILWGLAHSGQTGVEHTIRLLKTELDLAMALCGKPLQSLFDCLRFTWSPYQSITKGCSSVKDVDRSLVIHQDLLSTL